MRFVNNFKQASKRNMLTESLYDSHKRQVFGARKNVIAAGHPRLERAQLGVERIDKRHIALHFFFIARVTRAQFVYLIDNLVHKVEVLVKRRRASQHLLLYVTWTKIKGG